MSEKSLQASTASLWGHYIASPLCSCSSSPAQISLRKPGGFLWLNTFAFPWVGLIRAWCMTGLLCMLSLCPQPPITASPHYFPSQNCVYCLYSIQHSWNLLFSFIYSVLIFFLCPENASFQGQCPVFLLHILSAVCGLLPGQEMLNLYLIIDP